MKKLMFVIIGVLMVLFVSACETEEPIDDGIVDDDVIDDEVDEEYLYLTLEELAQFDGLEGRDAYIAVDGKIYDVTDSNYWSGGDHNSFQAGQDLTEEIMNESPHGVANLDRVPMIGEIVEE